MRTIKLMVLVVLIIAGVGLWRYTSEPAVVPNSNAGITGAAATSSPDFLPVQARDTLALIAHHGPFRHRQDGGVFSNREGHLPNQPRGYYHEYTVQTPGSQDRGARRIITGGNPPVVYYYTDDHYRSFHEFQATR